MKDEYYIDPNFSPEQMRVEEMKPCPVCGRLSGLRITECLSGFYCYCTDCEISTPTNDYVEDAILIWNEL